MTAIKMPPQLDCNPLVKENNEDREYRKHLKKIQTIEKSKTKIIEANENQLPNISKKKLEKLQNEIEFYDKENNHHRLNNNYNTATNFNIQRNVNNNNSKKILLNNYWNTAYDAQKNRSPLKSRQSSQIEIENDRMKKRLNNVKASIDIKKMDKDFELHQYMVKQTAKTFTPTGIGYRKTPNINALPDIKSNNNKKKKKNAISMLNGAVNKQERGDIVLIKTMLSLNYFERMETKRKYEETYNSELKKGLIKVMDKQYESLLVAILTDRDLNDTDRIYESLYEPAEAAVVITDSLITRNASEKHTLLETFKQKIEYDLVDEIKNKMPESDLKYVLIDLLKNENLDKKDIQVDIDKVKSDVEELKFLDEIPLNSDILLNSIRTESKSQIKALFDQHQQETGVDICSKMESAKSVGKVFKVIQNYLTNPALYYAEKLQKSIKQNETEFIRLLSTYSKDDIKQIEKEYKLKFKTRLVDDITNTYSDEISRLILQIINSVTTMSAL